jgi:hypothetical protein
MRAISSSYPFLRTSWLPYAIPSRKGRIFISGDFDCYINYLFPGSIVLAVICNIIFFSSASKISGSFILS